MVRDVRETATRRGLVLAGVVGSLAGLAVALLGQLSGLAKCIGMVNSSHLWALLLSYVSLLGIARNAPRRFSIVAKVTHRSSQSRQPSTLDA